MHYQIFRNKNSTEEQFQRVHQLYAKVVGEDKVLCELAQKNLDTGVFVSGEMHPRLEKGPLYFQKVARQTIREHFEREKAAKKAIWPARQQVKGNSGFSKDDEELCSGLACETNQSELAW